MTFLTLTFLFEDFHIAVASLTVKYLIILEGYAMNSNMVFTDISCPSGLLSDI